MSTPSDGQTVAVLGCGVLGRGLVKNLRRVGHELRLYNRSVSVSESVAEPSDAVCSTPAEAADGAHVVLAAVTDDEASRSIWCGRDGALQGASAGTMALEFSTISPAWADQWGKDCRNAGLRPVAVPVTGGRSRAEDGTLVVFAGGAPDDITDASHVLEAVGSECVTFSSIRMASTYKLLHNALAANALAGLVEALALADASGLPRRLVVEVLSRWGWGAPVAGSCGPSILEQDFREVNCSLANLAKDLSYALALSDTTGVSLPLAQAAFGYYEAALGAGFGPHDMAALGAATGQEETG
ncbi:NAD(P)-dependent oxidoreductase [Streptomyces sp. NPDC091217]|uniref:NAD(P)-dependent oxidoreductase n=1 Tax=Streptomyces sp. NPDC091217 TaxID=3365975 RepID=UPI00381EF2C0